MSPPTKPTFTREEVRTVKAMRHGLTLSKLPYNCKYIETHVNKLRKQLEDQVIDVKGEISITDAANIQTVCKWERHGKLCERWLRKEGDKLKPSERIQYSKEIADASTKRDKAIKALNLDQERDCSPWEALTVQSKEPTE